MAYQTKASKLKLNRYGDAKKEVLQIFNQIKKRTKRKPYIRSAYFQKQKIFFDYFWPHLFQKGPRERAERLQYFPAALEVIRHCRNDPVSKENPQHTNEILHRFTGITKGGELFYIQVKEDKRSGRKYFMSCFPAK